jgi:hypothetical protein
MATPDKYHPSRLLDFDLTLDGHFTSLTLHRNNGIRDRALHWTVHCTLHKRATRHVLTRITKHIDDDGGIFENVLH